MHKIQAKQFELSDFSIDHCDMLTTDVYTQYIIPVLEINRCLFNEATKELKNATDSDEAERLSIKQKKAWWQMIQLLPSSYNQKRTVMLNYEVLVNIYKWRKDHKLDEWRSFCTYIENCLPYSELITEVKKDEA